MYALPVPSNCQSSSRACIAVQIPGPPGPDCTPCADGTPGKNAWTSLVDEFVMPAVGESVTVTVEDTSWMVPTINYGLPGQVDGQTVVVQFAGAMLVDAILDDTHVSLVNIGEDNNAVSGSVIPVGSKVGPGGQPGAGVVTIPTILVGLGPPADGVHSSEVWIDRSPYPVYRAYYWNADLSPANWDILIA